LLLARGLGLDAIATWFAFGLVLMLPGWLALRALELEGELGRAGCAPVAAALGLVAWGPPLALAYLIGLPLGFVIGALACEVAALAVCVRRPTALPAAPAWELV